MSSSIGSKGDHLFIAALLSVLFTSGTCVLLCALACLAHPQKSCVRRPLRQACVPGPADGWENAARWRFVVMRRRGFSSLSTPLWWYVGHVCASLVPAEYSVVNVPARDGVGMTGAVCGCGELSPLAASIIITLLLQAFFSYTHHPPLHLYTINSSPWDTRLFRTPTPRSTARAAACAESAVRTVEELGRKGWWWVGKGAKNGVCVSELVCVRQSTKQATIRRSGRDMGIVRRRMWGKDWR